jgi:cytochrome oxidase Cu insertion factor (SCO1/SenC/PrrC family)
MFQGLGSNNGWKALTLSMTILVVMGLSGCLSSDFSDDQKKADALVAKPAFDFNVTDTEGHNFTLSNQTGQIVLLEFMWISCPACDSMLPTLKNINNNYDIVILEITVEPLDTMKDLKNYRKEKSLPWEMARDNNGTLKAAYSVAAAPTFYLIAKNQTVAWAHVGSCNYDDLNTEIIKIL